MDYIFTGQNRLRADSVIAHDIVKKYRKKMFAIPDESRKKKSYFTNIAEKRKIAKLDDIYKMNTDFLDE